MKLLTIIVPFVFYPGVFIGLFHQYGFNPLFGALLGLVGAGVSFRLGRRMFKEGKFGAVEKKFNLAILVLICVFLTAEIWNQAVELEIGNFASQFMTLFLTLGLCVFALMIESVEGKDANPPFFEKLQKLLNEADLVLSACAASVISGAVLILFLRFQTALPGFSSYASRFLERGVIPPLTLFLFVLGLLVLAVKYRKLREERRALRKLMDGESDHRCVLYDALLQSSRRNPDREAAQSFMNVVWAKHHSFYNIPRYITWAIPILGFLGTVLGISLTAEGINEMVVSQSGLGGFSEELGAALSPLGIAFDTTLVALSLSLLLVFAQLVMQRWEERILIDFESYVDGSFDKS